MAKELPYFKFHVSEWLNGSITLEDYYVQGVFTNICAQYWFKSGNLTLSELKRRLTEVKPNAFKSLLKSGIIEVKDDILKIKFLDEQLKESEERSKTNTANGALGGRPKKPNGLVSVSNGKPNQKAIREEKNKTREEIEKIGSLSENFVLINPNGIHDRYQVCGEDGMKIFYQMNHSVISSPEHVKNFLRKYKGRHYEDFRELFNSYNKFVELQYK